MDAKSQNSKFKGPEFSGPRFKGKSVLSGMRAAEAMLRAFSRMGPDKGLDSVIRQMIRAREDAVLVEDGQGLGLGVVTKTDIMAAFYGGLPLDTPAKEIMAGPPAACTPDQGLDQVVDTLRSLGIHQIFVADEEGRMAGRISFEDIAGLVYRLCRVCDKGLRKRRDNLPHLLVKEVMTGPAAFCHTADPLVRVMDQLASNRIRALPVMDPNGQVAGVISKTDLILAYLRGRDPETLAGAVMTCPVVTTFPDQPLSRALETMLYTDVQHLFVTHPDTGTLLGVVSLSDAARFRSGTCRACSPSRNF